MTRQKENQQKVVLKLILVDTSIIAKVTDLKIYKNKV
jgi:hypothetical protein